MPLRSGTVARPGVLSWRERVPARRNEIAVEFGRSARGSVGWTGPGTRREAAMLQSQPQDPPPQQPPPQQLQSQPPPAQQPLQQPVQPGGQPAPQWWADWLSAHDLSPFTVPAGEFRAVGGMRVSCPAGGADCTVTVSEEKGTGTATSTGGRPSVFLAPAAPPEPAADPLSETCWAASRSRRFSRRSRRRSSSSRLVRPSSRRPSSRSAWRTRLRLADAEHPNSRDSSAGVRAARTGSTIWRRYSGAYGGCFFDIRTPPRPRARMVGPAA